MKKILKKKLQLIESKFVMEIKKKFIQWWSNLRKKSLYFNRQTYTFILYFIIITFR